MYRHLTDSGRATIPLGPSYRGHPRDHDILWLIDYGTKTLCIGTQIIPKGTDPHPDRTRILELQSRGKGEIPQTVGFVRDATRSEFLESDFTWGHDLLEVLNDDRQVLPEDQSCIFERLKMVLYPVDKTQQAVDEIKKSLKKIGWENFSAEKLIEMHLRHIREAAMRATIQKYRSTSWTEDEIRAMDVHTYFTVPEISTEATIHRMQQLLTSAGFKRTIGLSECEAAGAWTSWQLLSENIGLPFRFQESHPYGDDELLVADAGGLTLNVSSYKCRGFVEDGARMHVTPTGNNQGSTCGAEMITLRFFQFVRDYCESHYGGFTSCHERLGYSSEAFERTLAKSFESYKVNFTEENDRVIKIHDRTSSGLDRSDIRFTITKDMMRAWFNNAFEEIIAVIDKVRGKRTKVIMLTGGFFRSYFLVEKLKERYESQGIYMPSIAQDGYGKRFAFKNCDFSEFARLHEASDPSVVKGGMARSIFLEPCVPHDLCMGVAEDEPYVSKIHPDARVNPSLIKRDRYTGGRFVRNRWRSLLAPGDLATGTGTSAVEDIWQEYLLAAKDNVLRKQVFVTRGPIEDHEPIGIEVDGELQLRPDIHEWGEVLEWEVDETILLQYRKLWPKTGRKVQKRARYLVWARLKVLRKGPGGMDVELSWEIAPPSFKKHTNEKGNFDPPTRGLTAVGNSILHDTNHSSFMQRVGDTQDEEHDDRAQIIPASQVIMREISDHADNEANELNCETTIGRRRKRSTRGTAPRKNRAFLR